MLSWLVWSWAMVIIPWIGSRASLQRLIFDALVGSDVGFWVSFCGVVLLLFGVEECLYLLSGFIASVGRLLVDDGVDGLP